MRLCLFLLRLSLLANKYKVTYIICQDCLTGERKWGAKDFFGNNPAWGVRDQPRLFRGLIKEQPARSRRTMGNPKHKALNKLKIPKRNLRSPGQADNIHLLKNASHSSGAEYGDIIEH